MATLGLTKLGAVNRILYAVNERPVSALQTGGSAIESDAERFLDDTNLVLQSYGWPENTRFFETLTPDGSGIVTLASDTLHVWPSGASEYRTLTISGDRLFDQNSGSFNLGLTAITVDRIYLVAFADASQKLKELITTTAACYFQQKIKGSATMDAMLQQERALAEMLADRNQPRFARRPINLQPIIFSLRQPQQNQG